MPLLVSLFFIAMLSLGMALHVPQQEAQLTTAVASAAATSVLAYREGLVDYLNANPSFVGTVADADFTPIWGANRDPAWTNVVVSGGTLYVYESAVSTTPLFLDVLYEKTNKSFLVGRNAAGVLVSATGFSTGITVPAAVPNGAITIVGK